jgi:hypothetical protein
MIRNLDVVQVRHQEVRVASDPDLGQVYDGDIAAVAVHNMPPPLGNFEENAPLLLAGIHARLVGDVVAVIDDDPYVRALRVCPGLDGQGPPRLLGIRLVPHSSAGAAAAGAELALAGPADVDDAYQVFDNGELAGHFGDFSGRKPEINLTSPECSRWRKRAITAQSPTRTSPHGSCLKVVDGALHPVQHPPCGWLSHRAGAGRGRRECCFVCHDQYPHELNIIEIESGGKAWIWCSLDRALNPTKKHVIGADTSEWSSPIGVVLPE